MNIQEFEGLIRSHGGRVTAARRAIIGELAAGAVLGAEELLERLHSLGQKVNRATVYRELASLARLGLISPVVVGVDQRRYELATGHHHHLVCDDCGGVDCVDEPVIEPALRSFERLVERKNGTRITGHQLYLTGLCVNCQEKK